MQPRVTGIHNVMSRLMREKSSVIARVSDAVEAGTVDIVNSAKANHGSGSHSMGRYENQTTLLTNSMQPTEPEIKGSKIIGQAGAHREYAADVEVGTAHSKPYPYMYPALIENANKIKTRIVNAMKGW